MSAAQQQHPTPETEFSPEDIQLMLDNLDKYSPEEQRELYRIVTELEARKRAEAAKEDLIEFCKLMQPDYKVGKHHRMLADLLMEIEVGREYNADGDPLHGTGKDRICVNMPPRHGKSQLVSIYFPAWFLGRNPDKKVLMVSHTTDLAVDFGRKVRNIINSDTYKEVFPHVSLATDSKSAGRWNTNLGENTSPAVWVQRLPVAARIYCWWTIPTTSKTSSTAIWMFLTKLMNGLRTGHEPD